jgi:AmmeMemoRadiSam system protein B
MEVNMDRLTGLRPSPIAGQWYPASARRLAESVDNYLAVARLPAIPGEVVAVMAPHAGHRYSGPVAGYSFAAVRGLNPELVAVVSPMHYPSIEPLLTTAHSAYDTPLGPIEVDSEALQSLNAAVESELGFGLVQVKNDPEHSLEIELPFLQRALAGSFRLLPVMVHDASMLVTRCLGHALAQTLRDRPALLVASTDLSHFYPQRMAEGLDAEVLRQVASFDPEGVLRVEEEGKGFACGRGALAAVLWAAKDLGANRVQILHHATSGDVTGDYAQVVGYGAAVITRQVVSEG